MAQYQQPPAGQPAGARPQAVTAAAVVLFVVGGLAILVGLVAVAIGGAVASNGGLAVFFGLLYLILGAAAIYAGVQILNLRDRGRVVGIVAAGIIGVLSLISLITFFNVFALLLLIGCAFVVYALITNKQYFTA